MRTNSIFLSLFLLFIFSSCDTIISKYNDWDDLEKLEKKERVWLPSFLFDEKAFVNNVFDIVESHNLDTNEVWGRFHYGFDISSFLQILKEEISTESKIVKKNQKRLKRLGFNKKEELTAYSYADKNFTWIIFINNQSNMLFFLGTYKR